MRKLKVGLPRPATVIAIIALCLTAGASATAATLITGKQVKNGSITGVDVKRGSLSATDLSQKARRSLRGATGQAGSIGPAGSPGPAGPRGESAATVPSRVLTAQVSDVAVDSDGSPAQIVELVLPQGFFALEANLTVTSQGSGDVCGLRTSDGSLHELQFSANTSNGTQVVLQGEFDNGSRPAGRVRVICSADDQLVVKDARVRATQVAQLE